MQDNKSQPLILAHSWRVVRRLSVHNSQNWDFNQHKTRIDHRRIALAIQEYDTTL